MATLTYHRKPGGTTYVYRQESYWDKSAKRSRTRQVCLGKLGPDGGVVYNKRFADPRAREALEAGSGVAESVLTGQSLVLGKATDATGLERVLRRCFAPATADVLLSLAWAVAAGHGQMYLACVWAEQNRCPAHAAPPSSQDVSRLLAAVSQTEVDAFLAAWARHRAKAAREQYCYDITSVSSHNASNPFVEWGHNRDRESLPQVNMALLTGVTSRIPTYYELHPGSMSDTKTLRPFLERFARYGAGRVDALLDRGFYSAANVSAMLAARVGFHIPVPANIKWGQDLIDAHRDEVESPEHVIWSSDDGRRALYGMTVLGKIDGKRVWKHLYYDPVRRGEHIASLFACLKTWQEELAGGGAEADHQWAHDTYFTITNTPKRGRRVRINQDAVDAYKTDRAGYWVILTNREKDAARALAAYRERSLVESQFDDMKNDLAGSRHRTHGPDTMRGRALVQFLSLVVTAQIRVTIDRAWADRAARPEDDRLPRHYPLAETMLRLGTYRETSFTNCRGVVTSAPTRAQRAIFAAFDIQTKEPNLTTI